MFEPIEIAVKRLDHAGDLPLPCYETSGSAGMDVRAAEALNIAPGNRGLAGTGFAFAIPEGYEIQVRPRSGLALKNGISIPNTPGTIDKMISSSSAATESRRSWSHRSSGAYFSRWQIWMKHSGGLAVSDQPAYE